MTLVTGAAGFVGNNLVRQLLQSGRRVRALISQAQQSLAHLDLDVVEGDVLQPASLKAALVDVDVVYHAAGVVSIENHPARVARMRQVNVEGTRNVAQACLANGVRRLIHFSSVHALGFCTRNLPVDESAAAATDPRYHRHYDLTKAEAEREVQQTVARGLDAVILNPVGILGPHDYQPSPAGEMLLQLATGRLPGLVQSGYHWVDARDVAIAALAAEETGCAGHRYIISGEFVTFQQLARWVFEETGSRPPAINSPLWLARVAAPLAEQYSRLLGRRPLFTPETIKVIRFQNEVRTSKAAAELGFAPRPMEVSVKQSVRWLVDHQKQLKPS